MLTQQFFTRVQLAKILNFKSDSYIKDLEKKGFIIPQIKPSKYTFNQVLFMMICKEIINVTKASWKYFIDVKFNRLLEANLIEGNILFLSQLRDGNELTIQLWNDDVLAKKLNDNLDGEFLKSLSKLNIAYKNTPTCHILNHEDYFLLSFSIEMLYQKLWNKCIELNIDLTEKDIYLNKSKISINSNLILSIKTSTLQKVSKGIDIALPCS